jgi:hypothetical protein
MLTDNHPRPEYDIPTAVTFLLAGLALGAMLSVVLSPLRDNAAVVQSSTVEMPAPAHRR